MNALLPTFFEYTQITRTKVEGGPPEAFGGRALEQTNSTASNPHQNASTTHTPHPPRPFSPLHIHHPTKGGREINSGNQEENANLNIKST